MHAMSFFLFFLLKELEEASLGTGLITWDGAIVLAKYIEIHPDTVRNKSVLEVGAGTGVAGTAAALLGAREILLTGETTRDSTAQHTAIPLPLPLPHHTISLLAAIYFELHHLISSSSSDRNTTFPLYCYAQIWTTLWTI
jgi:Lysine methyltransferase